MFDRPLFSSLPLPIGGIHHSRSGPLPGHVPDRKHWTSYHLPKIGVFSIILSYSWQTPKVTRLFSGIVPPVKIFFDNIENSLTIIDNN